MNVVAWKEFFDAFWLSKTIHENINHSSENINYQLKTKLNYTINYQLKTSELKNVEKLVKQTV